MGLCHLGQAAAYAVSLPRSARHPAPATSPQAGGQFLFASEIKSLFVHPEVDRELDPVGMGQLFTFWSTLAPTTVFRGIQELPPGHNLGRSRWPGRYPNPYWQLDYAPSTIRCRPTIGPTNCAALLDDATRLRLRADVPVGAYLSGGLDSSVTAALPRRASGDRLRTFSVTFEDDEFDESTYQQQVVDLLGVEHHAMRCSHESIARVFPDVVWHAEKPILRTAPAPLHHALEAGPRPGLKVVLTGEGADEMLGGYDLFKEAKVRRFCARQPDSAMRAALFGKALSLPAEHAGAIGGDAAGVFPRAAG